VQDDRGATKQRCLYCYLCYCLPNWTGEIPL